MVKAEGFAYLAPSCSLDSKASEDVMSCHVWIHLALETRIPGALESFSISRAIALQIPPIFH